MLKYTCKYWAVLSPLVKRSLKKHYGKNFAARTMKRAKTEYRAMLDRMDDIGKDNPMASNVYMCFVFLAAYRAAKGKISIDGLRIISRDVMNWKPLRCMGLFMNANRPGGIAAIRSEERRVEKCC